MAVDYDDVVWYYGHVDSYGAVHGKVTNDCDSHTELQAMSGKTWRWIDSDGFCSFRPADLDKDDYYAIARWLVKHGADKEHWSLFRLL